LGRPQKSRGSTGAADLCEAKTNGVVRDQKHPRTLGGEDGLDMLVVLVVVDVLPVDVEEVLEVFALVDEVTEHVVEVLEVFVVDVGLAPM
jgi:hypothetical protein